MPETRKEIIEEITQQIIENPNESWQRFIHDAVSKEIEKWDDDDLTNLSTLLKRR